MSDTQTAGPETGFTLDEALLAQRRQATAQRFYTVQVPALRAVGFVILCAILLVQWWQPPPQASPGAHAALPRLILVNLLYAAIAWVLLRRGHGRTGRFDLPLALFHVDVLVWLANLAALEQDNLFFAYFLLVRVVDQVGFGFRRAIYFVHVITFAYIAYAVWDGVLGARVADPAQRIGIASTLYLLGLYVAATGLVMERLRRRAQQAMRAAQSSLASAEQKAAALQVQAIELERARSEAERASLAKSQFLAVVSHEIRTPMNGILGASELLVETALSPLQQRYVHTVHRSATALLGLIDDVLDLSRIEAGKMRLSLSDVDLAALVADAVDLIALTVRDRPVTLESRLSPRLPARVRADPLRLRQLLVNLLHNAAKFTDRGKVQLEVAMLGETADAVRVRLSVRDTGIGIAADQLQSIFHAFEQGDGSSTRRHGGSGLGLAIVKDLAELMDGRVGVESELGAGSHFWVDLPLQRAAAAPAPLPIGPAEPDADDVAHVLLAEDDEVNQLVIVDMLKLLGCEVEVARNGVEACAAAAAGHFDIILMDCHMPEMDGYEATRRIRADEARRGVRRPIVAVTADTLAEDRERCIAAGMDDLINKPVTRAALAAAVHRWTGRRLNPVTRW